MLDWSAPRAGAAAWALALALGLLAFGAARDHVAIASAKGLSLALFVLTIVWASVYMFNLVDRLRGIDAIGRAMARLADDRLTQALLIGWGFSSFIQGITGFGVPIAVAAPLLIMLGFSPARAAGMALVGHGWAVTFGSMGSSYYTIQLVTGIEGDVIAPHMALLFAPVIVVSGSLVAHIHGGLDAVRRSLPVVIVAGAVMAAGMYVLASVGAPQIASSVPAVFGMVAIALVSRTPLFRGEPDRAAAPSDPDGNEGGSMPFWLAFMPYLLLITLSVISQIATDQGGRLRPQVGARLSGIRHRRGVRRPLRQRLRADPAAEPPGPADRLLRARQRGPLRSSQDAGGGGSSGKR